MTYSLKRLKLLCYGKHPWVSLFQNCRSWRKSYLNGIFPLYWNTRDMRVIQYCGSNLISNDNSISFYHCKNGINSGYSSDQISKKHTYWVLCQFSKWEVCLSWIIWTWSLTSSTRGRYATTSATEQEYMPKQKRINFIYYLVSCHTSRF